MKTRSKLIVTGCLVALTAGQAVATDGERFTLVVNASRPATLSRKQVADFFLKRVTNWPDGTLVAPIDLSVKSETRRAFSQRVFEQPTEGVVRYWQQQMYSGHVRPPLVKEEDGLLGVVKTTTGAIGYVAEGTALPDGVKAVTLTSN